jgi:LPXTG-motif cell wall-anchored protein
VTNTATQVNGSFSVLKKVTGDGAYYLDQATTFTVAYTYEGLVEPGTLTVRNGGTATGPELPVGTVVTLSEIAPTGGLSGGATWGAPMFVLPDGTSGSTATFTVGTEPVAVVLDNPTSGPVPPTPPTTPPLPNTGFDAVGMSVSALSLLFLGAILVLLGTRRRSRQR